MTPTEYIEAAHRAGVPRGVGLMDFDRTAAALLKIDERTARRYRNGDVAVPGPVEVALVALGGNRGVCGD